MALSIEMIEGNSHTAAAAATGSFSSTRHEPPWEYHLRKYLMLLAGLVATATYAASFSPPGGVWQETGAGAGAGRFAIAGSPVLYGTPRYLAFVYSNATAFVASIGVSLLLLVLNERRPVWLAVLRFVMVLDLLGLMGAYAIGSCLDMPSSVLTLVLVVALAAYACVLVLLASCTSFVPPSQEERPDESPGKLREQRKVLMLLATFAVSISYAAGLSPPGGFREEDEITGGVVRRSGDWALQARQSFRLKAFFFCNTAAFVASLLIIVLLLVRRLHNWCYARVQLCGFILLVLLGLLGAYAFGSCNELGTSAYVIALVGVVPGYIFLVMMLMVLASNHLVFNNSSWLLPLRNICAWASSWLQERGCHQQNQLVDGDGDGQLQVHSPTPTSDGGDGGQGSRTDDARASPPSNNKEGMEKVKSLLLLLSTLVATITYQAGLDPPGGVWSEDDKGGRYNTGDPILLSTDAKRYYVFFYCNSTAFVASLVVILMVRTRSLIRRHTLEVAMLLCLFSLIGAYAAGSCRDIGTSINLMALPAAALVYVVIHVVFFTLDRNDIGDKDNKKLEKRRKRLLLLAILVATITYQAGLTPPGGFWTDDPYGSEPSHSRYHVAGYPIMAHTYRPRHLVFLYSNSTSFMVSVTLIILLVNPNLYLPGIRSYALYVCMVIALFGLLSAYLAGIPLQLKSSIYIFVLNCAVILVIAFTAVLLLVFFILNGANGSEDNIPTGPIRAGGNTAVETTRWSRQQGVGSHNTENTSRRKYMMVLAILAASVTYQAGMKPPGSVLQDGDAAGNPVMQLNDPARYTTFLYCNSTSFVASVVVIVLLLQESLHNNVLLLYAMNTAIVLDLIGLLGAYAVGSSREWKTTGYIIALVAAVLAYIAFHLVLWFLGRRAQDRVNNSHQPGTQQNGQENVNPPHM